MNRFDRCIVAGLSSLACMLTALPFASARSAGEWDRVSSITQPFERTRALNTLLEEADSRAYSQYYATARKMSPSLREAYIPAILAGWAEIDPAAALTACMAEGPAFAQRNYIRDIFRAWAEVDPPRAYAAIRDFDKSPFSYYAIGGFFEGYAARNPEEAFIFLRDHQAESPLLRDAAESAATAIMRVWARKDPSQAMAAVLKQEENGENRWLPTEELGMTWFTEDPSGFRAAIARMPKSQRTGILGELARNGKGVNFENAPRLLSLLREQLGGDSRWYEREIFESLAKQDAPRAFVAACEVSDPETRRLALESVCTLWGKKDFDAAMQAIQTLSDVKLQSSLLEVLWEESITPENLAQNLKKLAGIANVGLRKDLMAKTVRSYLSRGNDIDRIARNFPTPEMRSELLISLISTPNDGQWRGINVRDRKTMMVLREWALYLPPSPLRMHLIKEILEGKMQCEDLLWANENLNPAECRSLVKNMMHDGSKPSSELVNIENFNRLPEGALRDAFMPLLAKSLAEQSPRQAQNWIASLPPSRERDEAYNAYVGMLAKTNRTDLALEAMSNLPEGYDLQHGFFNGALAEIALKDPEKTLAWCLSIQDADTRASMLGNIAWNWDTRQSNRFFAQMQAMGNSPEVFRAMTVFVDSWGYRDPEAAAAWMKANAQAPDSPALESISTTFEYWVSTEPMNATQWLKTLPEGELRTRAIFAMANSSEAAKSPEGVLAWICTLPAESAGQKGRTDAIVKLVTKVTMENADKANEILADPRLTSSEREAAQQALLSHKNTTR